MKIKLLMILTMLSIITNAQVEVINGPALENDRDNKMNRMLEGDEDSFYTYRIRSKGKGTSYYVEKYDKVSLKPEFSKEIDMGEERATKIEDVEYAMGKVFIFRRRYDKESDKMTLFYQTVSSSGEINLKEEDIISVNSDHYEFIDFDVFLSPNKKKFLIKASHKPNKEAAYKTEFILVDAVSMKKMWTKQVDKKLFTSSFMGMSGLFGGMIKFNDTQYIGLLFDNDDNVYYGYHYRPKNASETEERYKVAVEILAANSTIPQVVELQFDEDYLVSDVEFLKSNTNEIVVGGFLKDVIERKGRDLVKIGIFSFKINLVNNSIATKSVKMFDDNILTNLESNAKRSRYFKYKLDYIFTIGNDVYYVGEQYQEKMVTRQNTSAGVGTRPGAGGVSVRVGGVGMNGTRNNSTTEWQYEYMDVIVAKLNSKGEFEWIKNTPLRINMILSSPHVFKQYIAIPTDKEILVLCNEHPKNMERYEKVDFEPKDLKSVTGIHGSNFVCTSISVSGEIKHSLVFKNEEYCFAPIQEKNPQFMPPADCENFVKKNNNEIFIYTEDRGRDRFSKLIIK